MKYKALGFANMTYRHPFHWGWIRFRDFKVKFNQSLANRAVDALKREK